MAKRKVVGAQVDIGAFGETGTGTVRLVLPLDLPRDVEPD